MSRGKRFWTEYCLENDVQIKKMRALNDKDEGVEMER